jgi:hypothetical protein
MGKKFRYNILNEFIEPIFRPKGHAGILTETEKTKRYNRRSNYGGRGGGGIASFSHSCNQYAKAYTQKQFCTFKASYRYDKDLHTKHLAYIKREGKGKEGENPELYGADPENYESRMAKLHFRFIISPENQNVDLTLLTKEFINRLEFRTGYKLDWVATEHYNTGKKHSHVLINGFDLLRRKIKFSPDEIKQIMRESLRDICTDMLGPRTDKERLASNRAQIVSNTYTQLDRDIVNILGESNYLSLYKSHTAAEGSLYYKRLLHLKELGLVRYDPQTEQFIFLDNWQEQLRTYTRYNTFLEGLEFVDVHPSQYRLHTVSKDGPITGKVVKKYYMQDNSNNHAVILETSPKIYAYIPLENAPKFIPEGQMVKIEYNKISSYGKTKGATEISIIK